MKRLHFGFFFAFLFVATGCYHARVETGLTPSAQVISEPFAASWIGGLIPPKTVYASEQCPAGVAIVETQHSFVNLLVGAITFGIFTPMTIEVTCAASVGAVIPEDQSISIPENASPETILESFEQAAEQASEEGEPVFVIFE